MNYHDFQQKHSLTKTPLKLIVLLLLIVTLLSGCGSSGGGGGGGDENNDGGGITIPDINVDSLSYTGLTTQADITKGNAAYISVEAFMGGSPGISNRGLSSSIANIQTKPARPLLLVLAKTLEESILKIDITDSPSGVSTSSINSDIWTEKGNCGGMAYYTTEYNDVSGGASGTETYDNYCNDNVTMLGRISFSGKVNTTTGKYRQLSINFSPLYSIYQDYTYISQGTISYDYEASPVAVTMNLLMICDCDQSVYKYEDFAMTLIDVDGHIDFQLSGKFYAPKYGYVELSTEETFRMHYDDSWPRSGAFIATGGSGTSVRFEILSTTEYSVEIDKDDDESYNWSKIYNWNDDTGGR